MELVKKTGYNLRGRVQFPTGGNTAGAVSPRAKADIGEIPRPTVKSGWKKIDFFCVKRIPQDYILGNF